MTVSTPLDVSSRSFMPLLSGSCYLFHELGFVFASPGLKV